MTEAYETMKVMDESIIIFKSSPNIVVLWVDRGQPLNSKRFQNICPERERDREREWIKKERKTILLLLNNFLSFETLETENVTKERRDSVSSWQADLSASYFRFLCDFVSHARDRLLTV